MGRGRGGDAQTFEQLPLFRLRKTLAILIIQRNFYQVSANSILIIIFIYNIIYSLIHILMCGAM